MKSALHTTDIPPSACPSCHTIIDSMSAVRDVQPKPGDVSLCMRCGEILIVTPEWQMRLITEAEMDGLGPEETQDLLDTLQLLRRFHVVAAAVRTRQR